MLTIPFQDIVNKELRAKALQRSEEKGLPTSWQASKLGSCQRGILLERWGFPADTEFDDRTLRVFDMGVKIEEWIVEILKKQREIKIETQVRIENKELGVSGYADVVCENETGKKVYEIKSKRSDSFWYMDKSGAPQQNQMQLWLYLHILGIEDGGLVYVSKDDMSIKEFFVQHNNQELSQETLRFISILNECWKTETLPLLQDDKDWTSKYCRWHKQCKSMTNEKLKVILEEKKLKNFSKLSL